MGVGRRGELILVLGRDLVEERVFELDFSGVGIWLVEVGGRVFGDE